MVVAGEHHRLQPQCLQLCYRLSRPFLQCVGDAQDADRLAIYRHYNGGFGRLLKLFYRVAQADQ